MTVTVRSILTSLVIFLVAAGPAAADETTPCPADQPPPALTVSDPAGAGSLYATHILRARLDYTGGGTADARSFTAPGAQFLPEDNPNRPMLVSDTPGPLNLTAVVVITDPDRLPAADEYSCTTTVTAMAELLAPAPSVFGNFVRPRYTVPLRKRYSPRPDFSFTVKVAKVGADRSPFTVRARGSRRLEVPGPGARTATHVYPQREFEFPDEEESRACELLCAPVTDRGFHKRVEVSATEIRGGLKVYVTAPTGLHFFARGRERFKPTPYGVDVEVLQSGNRVARLRIAARCDSFGQSSRCRFKTIDTRR